MVVSVGLPRMRKEPGERRDFLPSLAGTLAGLGCRVFVESGAGSGMGYTDADYVAACPEHVEVVDEDLVYRQDVVLVLRAPVGRFEWLRPGATLISKLHFPTRPARVLELEELRLEAVSLDSIEDDEGRRLVVNGRAVAWNGLAAAFETLERTWPLLTSRERGPVRVTVMGSGEIGRHAVDAAVHFGNIPRSQVLARYGLAGVEVTTIGRTLSGNPAYLSERLALTDILVDATQRDDPSVPLIANARLGRLPGHAVICDLVVDPYLLEAVPPTVRGIEGIPQGSLDRWVFDVDDPAWDALPPGIPTAERRAVVSCYSWPGVHPKRCMELYGKQLAPLLEAFVRCGGMAGLRPDGSFHERALYRGSLRAWGSRQPLGELVLA